MIALALAGWAFASHRLAVLMFVTVIAFAFARRAVATRDCLGIFAAATTRAAAFGGVLAAANRKHAERETGYGSNAELLELIHGISSIVLTV